MKWPAGNTDCSVSFPDSLLPDYRSNITTYLTPQLPCCPCQDDLYPFKLKDKTNSFSRSCFSHSSNESNCCRLSLYGLEVGILSAWLHIVSSFYVHRLDLQGVSALEEDTSDTRMPQASPVSVCPVMGLLDCLANLLAMNSRLRSLPAKHLPLIQAVIQFPTFYTHH